MLIKIIIIDVIILMFVIIIVVFSNISMIIIVFVISGGRHKQEKGAPALPRGCVSHHSHREGCFCVSHNKSNNRNN